MALRFPRTLPHRSSPLRSLRCIARDDRGSVAIITGLACAMLMLCAGVAVDYARAARISSVLGVSVDAAALAGATDLSNGASSGEVEREARSYVEANLKARKLKGARLTGVRITQDHNSNTVTVTAAADVETAFMRIAGINFVPVRKTAVATFNIKDIELSLVLDVTGSMSGSKIRDLQQAARRTVHTLLDAAEQAGSDVRVGIVPYAASVNAGRFAGPATDGESRDGCVIERTGRHWDDDTAPREDAYFGAYPDRSVPRNDHYACPRSALMPLSRDRDALVEAIAGFRADGWTAGHIGAAWGWYQVSPGWARFWPASSAPRAYNSDNLVKAVVLMTDGEFNTNYLNGTPNGTSDQQARGICDAMKNKGVVIYTVGFKLEETAAIRTMRRCASTDADGRLQLYTAETGEDLQRAFDDITRHLLKLRLAK